VANPKGASAAAEVRREKALELRKSGSSYRQIGRLLGVSEAQAHRDVKAVLEHIRMKTDENAAEYVTS